MNSALKDRFTRGLIAGVLAGIVTLSWNLFSRYILNFATLLYWDFASAFIFHRPIENLWEGIFSFVVVKIFFGLLGIVFSFLIRTINSKLIILKGWVFGVGVWFAIYAVVIMFRIPTVMKIPSQNPISNFIGATLFGLSLGYLIVLLNKKSERIG